MTDQAQEEQIPNHLVMAELEHQLHAKTSELVIANARIRTRDERIAKLESDLSEARRQASLPQMDRMVEDWPDSSSRD